jgi:ABC-type transport system involved in multi-copper enzyme maturation permease subunit
MKKILQISKFTFIEVYRSKMMYGLLILALSLLVLAYVASEFAYGASEKVALDFAIGSMSISNIFIAILLGTTLLSKEIESKTLYMILSRPLSRNSFLIGKIIGLSSVLIFNTIFLTIVGIVVYVLLGGKFTSFIFLVSFFSLCESFLLMLFGVLFSLITSQALSVIFSILFLIVGHTISETLTNFFAKNNAVFSNVLKVARFIIPDLERLNLKDFLLYNQNLDSTFHLANLAYAVFYIMALLIMISIVFSRKNLD